MKLLVTQASLGAMNYENLNDGFTENHVLNCSSAYHVSEVAQPQKQTKLHHSTKEI
jgi:hypothetical protein